MNPDGLTLDYNRFDAAFGNIMATSKRDWSVVAREQMRGVMRGVIGVTPPASIVQTGETAWRVTQGGRAKTHGQALVKSDILSVYGGAGQLYDLIAEKQPFMAEAFWRHHKHGENDRASAIARDVTGKGMYPFDGGKAHQNLKRGRRRGRARSIIFYVTDPRPLKDYIKQVQERVGWLAGGWNEAAAALGIQPPQWIWKQAAPGAIQINISDTAIRIIATNAVKFASVSDLERRVQYALDDQAKAMERRYADFMAQKFRAAGFSVLTT